MALEEIDFAKIDEVYFESTTPFVTKIFKKRLKIAIEFAQIQDSSNILDVGSSYGYLVMLLHNLYPSCQCYGVDKDPDWVGHPAENLSNCHFRVADAKRLPFNNDYFDVVFVLDVLEHIRDFHLVIKEMHRVLKPNGFAILSGPTESWFYKLCRYLWTRQWEMHGHLFTVYDIEKKFKDIGFESVKRKSLPGIPLPELFRVTKFKKIK